MQIITFCQQLEVTPPSLTCASYSALPSRSAGSVVYCGPPSSSNLFLRCWVCLWSERRAWRCAILNPSVCPRCRWIHGNKCLCEEDLHKCENWLRGEAATQGYEWIWLCVSWKTAGTSHSLLFLLAKRLWESHFVQCSLFFFFFFSPPFSEFQRRHSKWTRANLRRGIKHKVLFLSVAFQQPLRRVFKAHTASPFQPCPTWDQTTEMFIEGTV